MQMYTFKKLSILFLFTFLWSSTFNVPGDYSTIQEAINASQDGDNIVVSSGTYYENINFNGKDIQVVGEDKETTIIDGSQGIGITELPNSGFEDGMHLWDMWPNWNSHEIVRTGNEMYNSDELFEAFDGDYSAKIWGLYEGNDTENNIFKTFHNSQLPPGTEIQLSAYFYTHNADNIMDGNNHVKLFIKYFDDSWNFFGMDYAQVDGDNGLVVDNWTNWNAFGVVPDGATTVQVGALFYQATENDHGSIYIDNFEMSLNIDFDYGTIGNVVTFGNGESRDALLENFTITNGYASGGWPENQGGGILIYDGSSPTLSNLNIVNNFAESNGGGLSAQDDCDPLISFCTIEYNETNNEGGGVVFYNHSDATLRNVTIENNTAGRGGAVYSSGSSIVIESSIIKYNSSDDVAGLYINEGQPFSITSTSLESNNGTALFLNGGNDHRISNVSISFNNGDGIVAHYSNNFQISNSRINNNHRGVNIHGSSPVISNTRMINNDGYGLSLSNRAKPTIVNTTIAYNQLNNNSAPQLEMINDCNPELINSIIWGENPLSGIKSWNDYGSPSQIRISYSIIRENIFEGFFDGDIHLLDGLIYSDPMFENASNGDFTLSSGSPAIDSGNPGMMFNDMDNTQNDIGFEGGRGILVFARGKDPDTWVDWNRNYQTTQFEPLNMGYAGVGRSNREYEIHFVNSSESQIVLNDWQTTTNQFGLNTYQSDQNSSYFPFTIEPMSSSWMNNVSQMWLSFNPNISGEQSGTITISSTIDGSPYEFSFNLSGFGYDIPSDIINVPGDVPDIQFAIDNAVENDTIKVASGTYLGKVDLSNKELYLVGDKDNYPILVNDIEASGRQATVRMENPGNSILKNFRIIGGEGEWCGGCDLPSGDEHSGGGIFVNARGDGQPPTVSLQNLIIENNNAMYGGGVFVRRSNLQMDNCIIRDNYTYTAEYYGRNGMGGALFMMHTSSDNPSRITNTRIETNNAHEGGAVVLWQNSWGGHKVEFENVVINGNTASYYSGIRVMDAKFSLLNSTIVDNHSTEGSNNGSGVHASNWGTARIVNSIIHNNHPYNLSVGGVDGNYDSLLVSNSIVEHGADSIQVFQNGFLDWQNTNLNVAPDFDENFGLLNFSVGIGEGSQSGTLYGWNYMAPDSDINGDPRPNPAGSNPDIGAIENPLAQSAYRLEVESVDCIHGDTAEVSINTLSNVSLSSIELSITGFQDQLEFLDIIADESTILGQLEWITYYNNTESLLITASAGSVPISSTGTLLKIRLAVPEALESQFLPITITDFIGDEDFTDFVVDDGGLQVVWGPDSEFASDNVTGNYPLTVNFNDQSVQGTYPINSWNWSFGNDSSSTDQNTSFTYLYPGEYDVTLRVEDEFGLADTTISPALVQVDTVYGDVSWNGVVQSFDASLILKHLVDIDPFSNLQLEVGDVNLSDDISTLDAYHILEYMVGLIDALPYTPDEVTGSTGDFMMDDMGAEAGMLIDIPITITNAENVNGLKGRLTYDPSVLALDTLIFGEFLNGYMIEMNETEIGQILFAASGNQPNTETGTIANLTFEVLEGFYGESSVTLSDLRVNENEELEVGAEMTINYVLGISKAGVPEVFALHQNYPNPFNPVTRINYDLPKDDLVKITVYDMIGRQVKTLINQSQTAGYRSVRWDATNNLGEPVSAGLYMYVIQAGEFRETRKMILLK
jgi:PKD repeat protein